MLNGMQDSYSITGDGSSKTYPSITAVRDNYLSGAKFAIIKNELFTFGGWTSSLGYVKTVNLRSFS